MAVTEYWIKIFNWFSRITIPTLPAEGICPLHGRLLTILHLVLSAYESVNAGLTFPFHMIFSSPGNLKALREIPGRTDNARPLWSTRNLVLSTIGVDTSQEHGALALIALWTQTHMCSNLNDIRFGTEQHWFLHQLCWLPSGYGINANCFSVIGGVSDAVLACVQRAACACKITVSSAVGRFVWKSLWIVKCEANCKHFRFQLLNNELLSFCFSEPVQRSTLIDPSWLIILSSSRVHAIDWYSC